MLTDQLTAGGLAPLAGIATALREDRPAVARGITTLYNSGVNEGRITDVKLQKRIMAGCAGVPLLRHRVILIARLRRRYADRPTAIRGDLRLRKSCQSRVQVYADRCCIVSQLKPP
ncbi:MULTISPECIES: hypothetical protein [unclassified Streptomyces]|uniref:hypothetical protein n=1 Tax=unclassified Streptomyces TaxID=2593676 RepID=UPI0030E39839